MSAEQIDVLAAMDADCDFIATMAVTTKRYGTKRIYMRADRYPGEKWTPDKLAAFARGQVDKWQVIGVEIEGITPMNDAARAALARAQAAPEPTHADKLHDGARLHLAQGYDIETAKRMARDAIRAGAEDH